MISPVRFTEKQIEFIKHMIFELCYEYWEESCEDIINTINDKENDKEK